MKTTNHDENAKALGVKMSTQSDVVAVLTAKSMETIIQDGGTSSWTLDRNNARKRRFAVCVRNAHAGWVEGNEPHGTAFLVGRVSDVVPSAEAEGRWLIKFSHFAPIEVPNTWKGWRNPVRYTSFDELRIEPSELDFHPMPVTDHPIASTAQNSGRARGLTIHEAKAGLAATYGVSPDQIEITVRG